MLGTSFLWWNKPSDVLRPIVLQTDTTIADILTQAGYPARHPYRRTPLDFISREEWAVSLMWSHDIYILRRMRLSLFARPITTRPYNRIPSVNWPAIPFSVALGAVLFSLPYFAIFVSAWNFSFPNPAERTLWRISSLIPLCFSILAIPPGYFLSPAARKKEANLVQDDRIIDSDSEAQPCEPDSSKTPAWRNKFCKVISRMENNSPDRDPNLRVPLVILIPLTILCAVYTLARVFILVEDGIGLRVLGSSAYETVEWAQWFPHF